MKRQILLIIMCIAYLAGCETSIFNTEPFVETRRDEQGNVIIKDTPRMWEDFKQIMQMHIESERLGQRAPGVDKWNKFWLLRIKFLKDGNQENPQKYIDYIIEARRAASLPELEWDSAKAD